jgi:signal transduction histidine kinase
MTSEAPHDFPSLKPGGHVCLPYAKEEEKLDAIAGFLHDGLVRGERCIYWGSEAGFAAMLPHLEARGVPVLYICERATLVYMNAAGLGSEGFDPKYQLDSIRNAVATARADGYTGLRIADDPERGARSSLNQDQLATFEGSLSQLLDEVHATGLCAFDQRTTDASSLEVALATHAIAIVAGQVCENPFFKSPAQIPGNLTGGERVSWMAANILETANARDLLDAENAALIVQNSFAAKRDAAYRRHIASLSRSIEARDRLLITAARWLSRPVPAMCNHLDEMVRDTQLSRFHQMLETCGDHLAAVARLSRGLDEIAGFLQMQVVLRPERIDLVEIARAAIQELKETATVEDIDVMLEGVEHLSGTWDRLRLTRLFLSLIRTARDQGYDTRVCLRIDDLGPFARIRFEFMLPHAPALSDSAERPLSLAYGPSGESDYERLAVHTWSAREIVRLMGGTLGISTWADARVVFTLDLPKSAPEAPPAGDLPWS